MSTKLTELKAHFEAVVSVVDGIESFDFIYPSENNILPAKDYPRLIVFSGNPDSTLSGDDFRRGYIWEGHNLIFRLEVQPGGTRLTPTEVLTYQDEAETLLLSFMHNAFSVDYRNAIYLQSGTANIRVSRMPYSGNAQTVFVQYEAVVMANVGCPIPEVTTYCQPVTIIDQYGNVIDTVPAGTTYEIEINYTFDYTLDFEIN